VRGANPKKENSPAEGSTGKKNLEPIFTTKQGNFKKSKSKILKPVAVHV